MAVKRARRLDHFPDLSLYLRLNLDLYLYPSLGLDLESGLLRRTLLSMRALLWRAVRPSEAVTKPELLSDTEKVSSPTLLLPLPLLLLLLLLL